MIKPRVGEQWLVDDIEGLTVVTVAHVTEDNQDIVCLVPNNMWGWTWVAQDRTYDTFLPHLIGKKVSVFKPCRLLRRASKLVPNTTLFNKLYPDAEKEGNFLRVTI